MRVLLFDMHTYERESFTAANEGFGHNLTFLEPRLTRDTAALAAGHETVCAFVNDRLDAPALRILRDVGVRAGSSALRWIQSR